jgi:hypothetical protein
MPGIGRTPHTHERKSSAVSAGSQTPIEAAASAAQDRHRDAAGTIEGRKWRIRARGPTPVRLLSKLYCRLHPPPPSFPDPMATALTRRILFCEIPSALSPVIEIANIAD